MPLTATMQKMIDILQRYAGVPGKEVQVLREGLDELEPFATEVELLAYAAEAGHIGYAADTTNFFARQGASWGQVQIGAAADPDEIKDADGDTYIRCEESPDEDYIRMATAGTDALVLDPSQNAAFSANVTLAGDLLFGDGDSGIAEVSDDVLVFNTAGAEAMRLDASGNVVLGNDLLFGDGDSGITEVSDDVLVFNTAGAEAIRLDASGNCILNNDLLFGDGDTGFSEPSDDLLELSTAGAKRASWTAGGNMEWYDGSNNIVATMTSLGKMRLGDNATPTERLEVIGSEAAMKAILRGTSTAADAFGSYQVQNHAQHKLACTVFSDTATATTYFGVNGRDLALLRSVSCDAFAIGSLDGVDLIFGTGDTERMRIDGTHGYVDVGAVGGLTAHLSVQGNTLALATIVSKYTGSTHGDAGLLQTQNEAGHSIAIAMNSDIAGATTRFGLNKQDLAVIQTTGADALALGTVSAVDFVLGTADAERMRFSGAGGIGFFAETPAAQVSDMVALTDNSGGSADNTVQALTDPADAPATADALRDDLVANLIPELRNNFADLTAKVNALRDFARAHGLMA